MRFLIGFLFVAYGAHNAQAAIVVGAAGAYNIGTTSATIEWVSNDSANSQVDYGLTTGYGNATTLDPTLNVCHSELVTGLSNGTVYDAQAVSQDAQGNTGDAPNISFQTLTPPPPEGIGWITYVTSVTISWLDNDPSDTMVQYGPTASYGSTYSNATIVDFPQPHSAVLTGLSPNTLYHFEATSTGAGGTLNWGDLQFITQPEPDTTDPVISVVAAQPWISSATLSWGTNKSATSQLQYGLTASYGNTTSLNSSAVVCHVVGVAGLQPSTTYYFQALSKDVYGDSSSSGTFEFVTQPETGTPTVSITNPANAATVGGTAVTVSGTASDPYAVSRVQFMLDGSPLGGAVNNPPYTITWNTTLAADGSHALTAVAWNVSGNTSTSAVVNVTVRNSDPAITSVSASPIHLTSATINWMTDEPSNSQIEYGTSTAYGSSTTLNGSDVTAHSQAMTGLSPDTTYYFEVKSVDSVGNAAILGGFSFTTLQSSTFPAVSIVAPLNGAAIKGTVTVSATASDPFGVTTVQFFLDGSTLAVAVDGSSYTFNWNTALSTDGAHTLTAVAWDSSLNFSTSTAVTVGVRNTPPQIASIDAAPIFVDSATINWITDEPANTEVDYGTSTNYGTTISTSPLVATHALLINALLTDTTYHYRVRSVDALGNTGVSADQTFTTLIDHTPPVISSVTDVVWYTSAAISWVTNKPANSDVNDGPTSAYGSSTTLDANYDQNHTEFLTGLQFNATYHFQVLSQDNLGNRAASADYTLRTLMNATPPVVSNVLTQIWFSSVTITWNTDVPSDSQIEYGFTTSYGSFTALNSTLVTSHSQTITGLSPTLYHFSVMSRDFFGILSVLGDFTFSPQSQTLGGFQWVFPGGSGPGLPGISSPYSLYAGNCSSATILAFDSYGVHYNFNGALTISQQALAANGTELGMTPGIAFKDDFQLGLSSLAVSMVNGYAVLGSSSDTSQDICFYLATEAPQTYGTRGPVGDLHLKVTNGVNSSTGASAGYVVWNNQPEQLVLLAPNQSLAPAMPAGTSGAAGTQQQGLPFPLTIRLTDQYYNPILPASQQTDTLRLASSSAAAVGFNPAQAPMAGGVLVSSVTVSLCSNSVTLTAQDVTSGVIQAGAVTVNMAGCNPSPVSAAPGFYQVSVPTMVVAGQYFPLTISVDNVNVPAGSGAVNYTGQLVPMLPVGTGQFTPAGGALSIPAFQFSIPPGSSGTYTYTIPNENYTLTNNIWIELVGGISPSQLSGASALAGPLQITPGVPVKILVNASPSSLGPLQTSKLTLSLVDQYNNGIVGATLFAQIAPGGQGSLNAGGASGTVMQVETDFTGTAALNYISGTTSQQVAIQVTAPNFPNIPSAELPVSISLLGNETIAAYPSPVNIDQQPLTIEYSLAQNSDVVLVITDLFGHSVWKQSYPSGTNGGTQGFNRVSWNGQNGSGRTIAAGVYVIHLRMSANGQTTTAKTKFGLTK